MKRKPWRRYACVVDGEARQFSETTKKGTCSMHEQVELVEPNPKADAVVRAAVRFANACSARKKDWRKRVDSIVTTKLELRRAVDRYLKERK